MEFQLFHRRAMVVGGTRGIGGAISRQLALEGALVFACGRLPATVSEMNRYLSEINPHSSACIADLSKKDEVLNWLNSTAKSFGGLDCLVIVASAQSHSWEEMINVDLIGSRAILKSAFRYLAQGIHPSVVFIGSKATRYKAPDYKAYSAIKAALVSYMSSLSREWISKGIRVNVVSPGEVFFEGGFWDRMQAEDPSLFQNALKKQPRENFTTPEQVANAVLFLLSPLSQAISGVNLLIDGGGSDYVDF